jgi:hypothetical protein
VSSYPKLELDEILGDGPVSPEDLADFFRNYEFDDEHWSVAAIKRRLLTEEQAVALARRKLDVYDILNGRYGTEDEELVASIYEAWNAQLGYKEFGRD